MYATSGTTESDQTGHGHTATITTGSAGAPSALFSGEGYSASLGAISVPASTAFNSASFTVEGWADVQPYVNVAVASTFNSSTNTGFTLNYAGVWQAKLGNGSSTSPYLGGGNGNAGTSPQFVVMTYNGTTISLFVNGVLEGTSSFSGYVPSSLALTMGGSSASVDLSNVAYFSSVLSNEAIANQFNAGFAPTVTPYERVPLAGYPGAYWGMQESSGTTMNDISTRPLAGGNGTYSGVTLGQPSVIPAGDGTSASFNGTSSYATVPYNSTLAGEESNNPAAAAWVDVTGGAGTARGVFSDLGPSYSGYAIEATSSNTWAAVVGNGSAWVTVTGSAVQLNTPTDVEVTITSAASVGLWVNGTKVGSTYMYPGYAQNPSSPIYIGAVSATSGFLPGRISDVSVLNYEGESTDWTAGTTTGDPTLARENVNGNLAEENCTCSDAGDPVNTANGDYSQSQTDISIPGRGPALDLTRDYNSANASVLGGFGYGWSDPYQMSLTSAGSVTTITQEDGSDAYFFLNGSTWAPPTRVQATLTQSGSNWIYTRDGTETFTFNSAGQLTSIANPDGYTTTLAYVSGQLSTATDQAGRTLTFTWTGGLITKVTDPMGRYVTYAYDASDNLHTVTDRTTKTETFTYDASHNLLTYTDYNNNLQLTNTYNGSDQVTQQLDGLSDKTTFAYATSTTPDTTTTTVTDPNTNVSVYTYTNGELVSKTLASGSSLAQTWTYSYDALTDGLATVTDPGGYVTAYTYDANGNQTSVTDPDGNITASTYNSFDEPLARTDANGVTTTYTYNADGNLTQSSTPIGVTHQVTTYAYTNSAEPGDLMSVTNPDSKVTSYTYDTYGDVASVIDPNLSKTTNVYDADGELTSSVAPDGNVSGGVPANFTTAYTYDPDSRVLTVTNPIGDKTTTTYDGDGSTLTTKDPLTNVTTNVYDQLDRLSTSTVNGQTTTYTYDPDGNKQTVKNPSLAVTTYTYDALNRVSTVTDADTHKTTYTYNPDGTVATVTDPMNRVTTDTYDLANRLVGVSYTDGTHAVTYGYDPDGHRTSMADGTGTTTYVYDALGRLASVTNGASLAVGYTWGPANLLTAISYPGGVGSVTRGYDPGGRLTSVEDWASNTSTFGYDASSNLTSDAVQNGVAGTYTYNDGNQLTGITWKKGTPTLAGFAYTPNADGEIASVTDSGIDTATTAYTYNVASELTAAGASSYGYTAAGSITSSPQMPSAGNDATGELCWSNSSGTATGTCAAPPTSSTTYVDNADGQRTSSTTPAPATTSYAWNQPGQLTSYTPPTGPVATYGYNGDGLRMSKTISAVTKQFAYDVSGSVLEVLSDGTNDYIYGPGGRVIEQVTGTTVDYQLTDAHGSVRALSNSTGSVIDSYKYDAYGNPTTLSGTAGASSLGYDGSYTDAESGLVYLINRFYDPATGQFLSIDPAVAQTGQPYGFANENPTNDTDPSGRSTNWGTINSQIEMVLTLAAIGGALVAVAAISLPVLIPILIDLSVVESAETTVILAEEAGSISTGAGTLLAGDSCAHSLNVQCGVDVLSLGTGSVLNMSEYSAAMTALSKLGLSIYPLLGSIGKGAQC